MASSARAHHYRLTLTNALCGESYPFGQSGISGKDSSTVAQWSEPAQKSTSCAVCCHLCYDSSLSKPSLLCFCLAIHRDNGSFLPRISHGSSQRRKNPPPLQLAKWSSRRRRHRWRSSQLCCLANFNPRGAAGGIIVRRERDRSNYESKLDGFFSFCFSLFVHSKLHPDRRNRRRNLIARLCRAAASRSPKGGGGDQSRREYSGKPKCCREVSKSVIRIGG